METVIGENEYHLVCKGMSQEEFFELYRELRDVGGRAASSQPRSSCLGLHDHP